MSTTNESANQQSTKTLLCFDTATATLAVALWREGELLESSQSFTERNHSVRIITDIQDLMSKHGITPSDISAIAVGQGPGSYTGVRIAVTAAKTLAWTWNKPLIGLSSLEALALGAWLSYQSDPSDFGADAQEIWVVPILDARRGQVYGARFAASQEAGAWTRIDQDGIRLIADWAEELGAAANKARAVLLFVGEIGPHEETITKFGFPVHPFAMEAGALGRLAEERLNGGQLAEPHGLIPNYTQLTEAEVKLRDSGAGRLG